MDAAPPLSHHPGSLVLLHDGAGGEGPGFELPWRHEKRNIAVESADGEIVDIDNRLTRLEAQRL